MISWGIERRLAGSRFFRAVISIASATAVGQLILLLATPLLTRIYTPDDFGVLAVFSAVLSVILVISSLRLELAIPLPKRDRFAKALLLISLKINIVIATICLLLVALFREEFAIGVGAPSLAEYLWILPLAIVCAGSYKAFNYWAVRKSEYGVIAKTKIYQSLSSVLTQTVAGFAGLGALGLVVGNVVGQAAGAYRLSSGSGVISLFRRGQSQRHSSALLSRYINFPKYDAPAAFIDAASSQLPNLLLAVLFNPAVAGFYMLAERVLSMPMALLGQAVGQVLFGSSRAAIDGGYAHKLAIKIVAILSVLVVLPMLCVFFFAGDLFEWFFGDAWREAGIYASWMVVGLSAQFVYSPVSMLLLATGAQRLNLLIHVFMLISKSIALAYGYSAGSAMMAIIGISLAGVVGYSIAVIMLLFHVRKFGRRTG
ncbi:lipopolysaccharide biosynthesis protein [Pseudomonas sp. MAHUQ-62]|uniref:lipopolysaccharide biosynthesis protein n=1 Tax=Pseudomonas sp. GCM10023245 TaxID=3252652 RepID=UPI00360819C6